MDEQLLVRTYNVGLGDCIYVRVPDQQKHRHILIDCGNTDGDEVLLGKAVDHLAAELAADSTGNHALDLLVVTHPHQDHIAGFGLLTEKFQSLPIRNIWLSASMDPSHPQSENAARLQGFADRLVEEFVKLPLGPAMNDLALELFSLSNEPALQALRDDIPQHNGIEPTYVNDEEQLPAIFEDPEAKLHVLGPRRNIDSEYLGRLDELVSEFMGLAGLDSREDLPSLSDRWNAEENQPANISSRDFRRLRTRLFKNALAFAFSHSELVNNTSVVLLLEWHKRRLLFTGDAQFLHTRKGRYEQGKKNGSWNVMWHYHQDLLESPVDFLKVGHHGSHNATPWLSPGSNRGRTHPINEILDALISAERKTEVVVSTERMKYPTIPDQELMKELGKRVATRRRYDEHKHLQGRMTGGKWAKYSPDEVLVPKNVDQPLRTDLEHQKTGQEVPFIEVRFPPA